MVDGCLLVSAFKEFKARSHCSLRAARIVSGVASGDWSWLCFDLLLSDACYRVSTQWCVSRWSDDLSLFEVVAVSRLDRLS